MLSSPRMAFKDGYDFFQRNSGALKAGFSGEKYIDRINDAIKQAQFNLNETGKQYANQMAAQAGGFMAEQWHAGTFNINATVEDSKNTATVLKAHEVGKPSLEEFAKPDIKASWGDDFGLKYIKNAEKSAFNQSESFWEKYNEYLGNHKGSDKTFEEFLTERGFSPEDVNKNASIYEGQVRLIPKDQLDEAINVLKRKIAKDEYLGKDVTSFKETLENLTDRIKSPDGVESIPLSKEDSTTLAELARDGKLDLNEFGLNTERLVKYQHIFKQAINTGISAAVISMVLKLAPEIYKAIDKLIKERKIEVSDLQNIGFAALSGSAQGFINGSISAAITTACLAGIFGTAMKSVNPSVVGTLTVLITNTIFNSMKFATGKISKQEFAQIATKDLFLSLTSVGFGTFAQILVPEFPAFSFLIGSFLGSIVGSFVYEKGISKFMSLCCDTGFTCFGLVEQNYKIPDEILKSMNIKSFDFKTFIPKTFELKSFELKSFGVKTFNYETFGIRMISRDVIGFFKVGYTA